MGLSEALKYVSDIHKRFPSFNAKFWVPPTFRTERSCEGYSYRNFAINTNTGTLTYDMKTPNGKWQGPFHGRSLADFGKMKEVKND